MTTLATCVKCLVDAVMDFTLQIIPLKDVFLFVPADGVLHSYTGAQTTLVHFLMNIRVSITALYLAWLHMYIYLYAFHQSELQTSQNSV